jgi:anti-sigma factor RsiW
MANWQLRHPDEGMLLRYLDGELAAWKARGVRRHLAACWQCRAEVEALEGTVADCMRYRKQVLGEQLPEPPQPWTDLQRGFERIDAEMAGEPFWKRLGRTPAQWQWGLAATLAAAALVLVFLQLRETPPVEAAVLLNRAVTAANREPVQVRHLRIRTPRATITRTLGTAKATSVTMPAPIDDLFASAHYNADDPLSARSFQEWRNTVPQKTDDVATVPDPQAPSVECYRIRTVPAEGAVATATLTLRTGDLHPVEGKLEFRDRDWIEFTEVTELPSPKDGAASAVPPAEASERPAVPSRPAAVAPGPTASISDELQVVAALHQIGADLGDPVEVKRTENRVRVSGVGVAPQRQRQIEMALAKLPNVAVDFSTPNAGPPAPESAPPATVMGDSVNSRMETRLEQQLGSRAEVDRLSARLLDANETAMSHVYALRSLAERFPATEEQAMSAGDRELLHNMVREHLAASAAQADRIAVLLQPVLKGLGGTVPPAAAQVSADAWQPAATSLFGAAHRVEVLLSELLGVTPASKPTPDLPSQLLGAIGNLRDDLAACRKSLAQ